MKILSRKPGGEAIVVLSFKELTAISPTDSRGMFVFTENKEIPLAKHIDRLAEAEYDIVFAHEALERLEGLRSSLKAIVKAAKHIEAARRKYADGKDG